MLASGDIAEAPTIKDILQELAEFIEQPIYFVLGNHDYYRGQIDAVRREMGALTKSNEHLFWLPAFNPLQLDTDTLLVGQDGLADGRLGDYHNSRVALNDSRMITDLFQEKMLGRSHSLATASKLFSSAIFFERLIEFFNMPGSIVLVNWRRASSRASLAADKLTSGKAPKESFFSIPEK